MFRLIICFNLFIFTYAVQHPCRDENNNPVDWYVLYKLPQIKDHENKLVHEGKAYAYITSNDNNGWKLSTKPITDSNSIPGLTLAPLYQTKGKNDRLYILYNDAPPVLDQKGGKDVHFNGGHAKGALLGDKSGGFWLVHSVPKFAVSPDKSKVYAYPPNGFRNGQSFLCITLKPGDLDSAGDALKYNEIHAHAQFIPMKLKASFPKLAGVINGDKAKSAPWKTSFDIVSESGAKFKVFAKSEKLKQELYSDWVAPDLKVNLMTQTWPQGRSHQHSSCGINYRVENVEETKISNVQFTTSKDHSKWAASETKSQPWICVGDINKDNSQGNRGGGTVCMEDPSVWKAYHDSAVKTEKCAS